MDAKPAKKTIWNKDTKFALNLNKFIIWPLGLWPLENDDYFSQIRRAVCVASQIWNGCTLSLSAYRKCGDSTGFVDYVMNVMCVIMALAKMIAFQVHREKLCRLMSSALEVWKSDNIQKIREVLRPFVKTGRRVFCIQIYSCYFANINMMIAALPFFMPSINETSWNNTLDPSAPIRLMPLKTECLFGHYRDGLYFSAYALESFSSMVTAHGNVGCDVVIFSLAMHLCGQIELLKLDLMMIGSNEEESGNIHHNIFAFIKRHCQLLELIKTLDNTVSAMLVIQLLLNAALNLMLGIRILMSIAIGQPYDALRPIIAFVVIMLQLYLLSYASDRLSQQAESVLDAIYDSNWYNLPIKHKKDLYVMMSRTSKPIYLRAGKFYSLNLENFKSILKTSFSYFSIFRLMFDKLE